MNALLKAIVSITLALSTISAPADDASVQCLAKNIYYEARGESIKGKLAVAKVTLNRVNSNLFANTVCEVVYQKHQFSWTKSKQLIIKDMEAWNESLHIAREAITTGLPHVKLPALYFHNKSVSPNWNKKLIATIEGHHFYK